MNIPCPDKPLDDPYVWELIELDLHNIDKSWWATFSAMGISMSLFELKADSGPLPPKQPIQLKMYLHSYALELFNEEFKHYPNDPQCSAHWAQKLAERVEARIIQRIAEIETSKFAGSIMLRTNLGYHGVTQLEMRETIRECLKGLIGEKVLPEPQKQGAVSTPPSAVESKEPATIAPVSSEIERRKALLAEYKAGTGDPADYRIYNARNSGIHKPEFYQWKKGVLSRDSETTKNFERFLREKKTPIPRKR